MRKKGRRNALFSFKNLAKDYFLKLESRRGCAGQQQAAQ